MSESEMVTDWSSFEISIGVHPLRWFLEIYVDHYWVAISLGPLRLSIGWSDEMGVV